MPEREPNGAVLIRNFWKLKTRILEQFELIERHSASPIRWRANLKYQLLVANCSENLLSKESPLKADSTGKAELQWEQPPTAIILHRSYTILIKRVCRLSKCILRREPTGRQTGRQKSTEIPAFAIARPPKRFRSRGAQSLVSSTLKQQQKNPKSSPNFKRCSNFEPFGVIARYYSLCYHH